MNSEPQCQPPVLVLAPFGKDTVLVGKVLAKSGIALQAYATMAEFTDGINDDAGAAILTEESLDQESIDRLAQKLATQPRWSNLPIIVLTGSGISTATTESAVRSRAPLGNLTLLERPLRPATLISAVRGADASSGAEHSGN
jgi:FixJ family two-component response regulator